MSWTIFNAHVYLRHVPLLEKQIEEPVTSEPVQLSLPEDTSYFDVPLTEIKVVNYNPNEKELKPKERTYRYEVAI